MSRTPTKRRGPMGGHGGMGMSVEKAKDFKGTMKNRGNPAVSDRPVCGQRFVQLYSGLYHDECVSKADLPLAEKYF